MTATTPGPLVRLMRFVGRYAIAALMIPVGVALGIGGLVQFGLRRSRRRATGTGPAGRSPGAADSR